MKSTCLCDEIVGGLLKRSIKFNYNLILTEDLTTTEI